MKDLSWLKTNPAIPLIICPSKKFLYFRLPKNAGTSIYINILKVELPDCMQMKYFKEKYDEALNSLTLEDFNSWFKFVIVRNPYARAVSSYVYLQQFRDSRGHTTLESFLKSVKEGEGSQRFKTHTMPQHPGYMHDGELFCDYIGKVEELEECWPSLADRLGVSRELPHANKSGARHYSHYYDAVTKAMVEEIYSVDFEYLNYRFEEE